MSKTKTNRLKKDIETTVPQSKEEAAALAREIAAAMLSKETLIADRDTAVLAISEPYDLKIETIELENAARHGALETWSSANVAEFGKKKSLELSGHTIGWRTGQPKLVTLSKWTLKKVLENLLEQPKKIRDLYIRTKQEVNKEAFIARRDDHPEELAALGVKVTQAETFFFEANREGQDGPTLTTK